MTAAIKSNIGRTVKYTGDMANFSRTGYVLDEFSDRWGAHVIVAWDDMGKREGLASTSTIPAHLIFERRKRGGRFFYA